MSIINYLEKKVQEVTAPREWQSSPESPPTKLAYITQPEIDMLVKANIHGSMKGKPNKGPEDIMSLDGGGKEEGYSEKVKNFKTPSSRIDTSKQSGRDKRQEFRDRTGSSVVSEPEAQQRDSKEATKAPVKEQNILQKILFGDKQEEMSAAKVQSEALRHGGRTKDLFGNELNYVKFLDKYGIGKDNLNEIRKYGNRPDLAARAFFESILNKQIASNPLDQDLLQRMTDYEVPLDPETGEPLFDSYRRIGIGDKELYGSPFANVPFLSGLGSIIPNTRNDFASLAADSVVGFPGATSMARGIMDKIAGGSGDYTSAQRYFKNYFPDDQAKVNQLALASLDPKFQRDVFESPVYAASQNYNKARNTLPEREQAAPLGLAALAPTPTVTTGPTPYNATIYSNNATGNTTNNATGNTTNNATAFSPYASTANYKSLGIPQVAPNAPGGFSGAFPGYYDYLTKYFGR